MSELVFPPKDQITIQFAHIAYQFEERFAKRETGIEYFQTWSAEDTLDRASEADVLVLTGFWSAKLLAMSRSPAVRVYSRPLRYRMKTIRLPGGEKHSIRVGEEKGIDVAHRKAG